MNIPRLRVFAGPNGSGKSNLQFDFANKYPTGHFINADLIEKALRELGYISLNDYDLTLDASDWLTFCNSERASSLIKKAANEGYTISLEFAENKIVAESGNTYHYEGALIALFIRYHMLQKGIQFCYETVMSHPGKVDELLEAKKHGFKTYLYYICIDDPLVNVSRVQNRVEKGGHDVPSDKIIERHARSLENLIHAIDASDKVYLFDNSQGDRYRLIAKITEVGELRIEIAPEKLPRWFNQYVIPYFEI